MKQSPSDTAQLFIGDAQNRERSVGRFFNRSTLIRQFS